MIKIDAIVNEDKIISCGSEYFNGSSIIKISNNKKKIHINSIKRNGKINGYKGTQMGYREKIRGYDVDINVLPKVKFEIVVSSQEWADRTIDAICKCAHTGEHGDGKIFVYELADVIRIRTGEHGPKAVWAADQTE